VRQTILPAAIAMAAVAFPYQNANAHGNSVIYNPYVHEGEAALETKGSYLVNEHDNEDAWAGEVTGGYGVTSWWHTEAGFTFEGHEDEDTDVNAFVFENKFQLAPAGAWPVDVGVKIDYAKSLVGGADELGGLLLLSKNVGQFTNTSNIGIAREIGEDSGDDAEYSFAYGLSYNVNDTFAIGGEWHSDFGTLENDSDDFDEQSHRIGPVAYGEITEGVLFETGVLFGVSDEAPDAELKAVLEYEF
jgi:long-subunit fatty acid transport protein